MENSYWHNAVLSSTHFCRSISQMVEIRLAKRWATTLRTETMRSLRLLAFQEASSLAIPSKFHIAAGRARWLSLQCSREYSTPYSLSLPTPATSWLSHPSKLFAEKRIWCALCVHTRSVPSSNYRNRYRNIQLIEQSRRTECSYHRRKCKN